MIKMNMLMMSIFQNGLDTDKSEQIEIDYRRQELNHSSCAFHQH